MDKLKKLSSEKMLELWNKGKISSVEALSYLIHQVIETQNVQTKYNRKLTDMEQSHLALRLMVYELKSDIDSIRSHPEN